MDLKNLLRVTFVGRPNVGKSTLFNRLVGKHEAITSPEAGTTRDRIERVVTFGRGVTCILTDVGGITTGDGGDLEDDIQAQVRYAVAHTDLVVFVIDAKTELTSDDYAAADLLRRAAVPAIFVANKWESGNETDLLSFASLGIGLPIGVSALHIHGFDELKDRVMKDLRKIKKEKKESTLDEPELSVSATITLIGRPNVGKSSLLNCLLGEKRAIVSPIPCTTRDTTSVYFEKNEKTYRLIDTAGLRRAGKVGRGIDRFATGRTLNAISDADVALLLLDGEEGITAQDLHVAQKAFDGGVSVVLVVNKIDTWKLEFEEARDRWLNALAEKFAFARYVPVVMISAQTGKNVEHLFEQIDTVRAARDIRVPTAELNALIRRALSEHPPGYAGKSAIKIYYGTQVEIAPPTFIFFTNRPEAFHFSYSRYIENKLREIYAFAGTPLRVSFRGRGGEEKDPKKSRGTNAKRVPKKETKRR